MATQDEAESTAAAAAKLELEKTESTTAVMSELKKQSSGGTNIIKEYKDIFSKASGSDLKNDKVSDEDNALALLKSLIEEKKLSAAKADDKKIKKWDFATSPYDQFGKTLDDTFIAFLAWAKVKQDTTQVNVSKAFRRLESYADWMHETGTDLTEPALTSTSIKKTLDAWAFNSSIDTQGRLVWWLDVGQMNLTQLKKEFKPEDHLRAFVWYTHAVLYNKAAQTNGLVFIENVAKLGMVDSFTLIPAKLATKLDRLTIGVLPIKMQCMYMFESPMWVNVLMKIVGVFMSKKMKERMVFLKSWDESETDRIGGLGAIPKGFGKVAGTLEESVIEKLYFGES